MTLFRLFLARTLIKLTIVTNYYTYTLVPINKIHRKA